jgi:hypothetical protein
VQYVTLIRASFSSGSVHHSFTFITEMCMHFVPLLPRFEFIKKCKTINHTKP